MQQKVTGNLGEVVNQIIDVISVSDSSSLVEFEGTDGKPIANAYHVNDREGIFEFIDSYKDANGFYDVPSPSEDFSCTMITAPNLHMKFGDNHFALTLAKRDPQIEIYKRNLLTLANKILPYFGTKIEKIQDKIDEKTEKPYEAIFTQYC